MQHIRRTMTVMDQIMNTVIDMEWEMFQNVRNAGGKASCQNDPDTFYIMRYSNYCVMSQKTIDKIRSDYLNAKLKERNLVMERYAYMMAETDPDYFEEYLQPFLPVVSTVKNGLVECCMECFMKFQKDFIKGYPVYAAKGRPMEGAVQSGVSVENYMRGELKTYSEDTLESFLMDLRSADQAGHNLVEEVQKATVGFYGYQSIEEAQAQISVV